MAELRALFSTRGRLGRLDYSLVFVGAWLTSKLALRALAPSGSLAAWVAHPARLARPLDVLALGLLLVIELGVLWVHAAVSFQRLHDTGRSSGWLWLLLVPGVATLLNLALVALPGTDAANPHGCPRVLFPRAHRFLKTSIAACQR